MRLWIGLSLIAGILVTAVLFEIAEVGCPEGWLLVGNVDGNTELVLGEPVEGADDRCLRVVDGTIEQTEVRAVWR